jgi:hypothetical protein
VVWVWGSLVASDGVSTHLFILAHLDCAPSRQRYRKTTGFLKCSIQWMEKGERISVFEIPTDHLLLDRSPNIGPLKSSWELHKFKNCWNNSFKTSRLLTLLYQQFSKLLIS